MRIVRILLTLLVAGALAWLTVGVGMANLTRAARPATALSLYPFDARAKANMSEKGGVLLAGNRALAADVERLARSALSRDPTVVDAWRMMGVVAALREDGPRATQTLRFAERISRRDLPVQLWLIEDMVGRDDVAGALRHYDIALRTSPTSRQLLFPILIAASAEPNVARPLAGILAANPPWRSEFTYSLSQAERSSDTLPFLVRHLATTQSERDILIPMVQKLATAGDYRNAWQVYTILKQAPARTPEPIRDGGFAAVPAVAPFDWFMVNEGAIRGERRVRDNSGEDAALFVSVESGAAGEGARQLLLLAPGSYQVSAVIGSVPETPAARVSVRVACAGATSRVLGETDVAPTQIGGASQRLTFTVPAGCPAQVLAITAGSASETGASEAWLDNISISRS